MRIRREKTFFTIGGDGVPLKVLGELNGNLQPAQGSPFVRLVPDEENGSFKVEKFRADSIKVAAEKVGAGLLGAPVGRVDGGVVFRVIRVS